MIPNLNFIITILACITTMVTLTLFLPAFIELKKPRDNGPRQIIDIQTSFMQLASIEKEQKFDKQLIDQLSIIFAALPNIES
jgi:hypothetical protein